MKKIVNRVLCAFMAVVICLLMVGSFTAEAEVKYDSDSERWKYFFTGGTGDFEGVDIKYFDEFDDKTDSKLKGKVSFPSYCKYFSNSSSKKQVALLTYNLESAISRFKLAYSMAAGLDGFETSDPYYLYSFGIDDSSTHVTSDFSKRYIISAAFSLSPMRYEIENNKYCLKSDSEIYICCSDIGVTNDGYTNPYGYFSSSFFNFNLRYHEYANSNYYDYSSDVTDIYSGKYFVNSSYSAPITWQEIYSNCDLEINGQNLKNEPFKKLKDQIEVKLTPEFGLDMDIKKDYDDRIVFSVTNNSDSPIQFLAYIDTPDNKDYFTDDYENKVIDYELPHCIIEPAYEKAIWNYEIEDYYYSLDFSNDSKKLGFQQKCKIDTSKCYGATVFIYLDSGQTYTDNVYWKNIHMSTGKEYRLNFLVFPLNVDTATNIFDIEKYKNEDVHSVFGSKIFKQLHWWTLDYKVSISEIAQIYNVDYSSGVYVYQQNFSLLSIPTYTPSSVGGKGLISQGFSNDSALNDKLYNYNMDTGNETFNNLSSDSFSVNVDVDNISVDNVKDYIKYSTDFFGLIKGTLSTFPTFIWALIFFGLTAFVVIAFIKWIIH